MKFNVNTDEVIKLSNRLEKLSRSAFPVAVRQTLNDAAFDVKSRTLNKSASNNFIIRNPTFFKTFSGVDRAKGFNVNKMQSTVGFNEKNKSSGSSKSAGKAAIEGLERQEHGGVNRKNAIYLSDTRGGSNTSLVKRSKLFKAKNNLDQDRGKNYKNEKSKFIANAYASKRQRKSFSIKTSKGRFLIKVTNFKKSKDGSIDIKTEMLMKSRSSGAVQVKPTHFMKEAADMTIPRINDFFIKQAEKRFSKALKL